MCVFSQISPSGEIRENTHLAPGLHGSAWTGDNEGEIRENTHLAPGLHGSAWTGDNARSD